MCLILRAQDALSEILLLIVRELLAEARKRLGDLGRATLVFGLIEGATWRQWLLKMENQTIPGKKAKGVSHGL